MRRKEDFITLIYIAQIMQEISDAKYILLLSKRLIANLTSIAVAQEIVDAQP
jgi:hypothetical protein